MLFGYIGAFFTALLNYVDAGSSFVFGDAFGEHFFAFKVLPTIIFFAALMGVLYHLGLVQYVVMAFASVMQRTLRTSGAESLAAATNIFVGQTEAPLVVRPYVASMTRSELMALMVGGFATIAGGVLAAYVGLGIDAGHLVAASVISAPAALLVAKVMQPEVEESKTLGRVSIEVERTATNVVEAAANGTLDGLRLALNVAAMLIAALGLIALVDGVLGLLGQGVGYLLGIEGLEWSLSAALGYLFAPFAYLMGIEAKDCLLAGELLGKENGRQRIRLVRPTKSVDPARLGRRAEPALGDHPDLCPVWFCQLQQHWHPARRHRRHCPRAAARLGAVGFSRHAGRFSSLLYDRLRGRYPAVEGRHFGLTRGPMLLMLQQPYTILPQFELYPLN